MYTYHATHVVDLATTKQILNAIETSSLNKLPIGLNLECNPQSLHELAPVAQAIRQNLKLSDIVEFGLQLYDVKDANAWSIIFTTRQYNPVYKNYQFSIVYLKDHITIEVNKLWRKNNTLRNETRFLPNSIANHPLAIGKLLEKLITTTKLINPKKMNPVIGPKEYITSLQNEVDADTMAELDEIMSDTNDKNNDDDDF